MKTRVLVAVAALLAATVVLAQSLRVVSVDTVSDLLLRSAIAEETVMVLNQSGDTFGPPTWYRHVPAGGLSGPGVLDALPSGQWVLVESPTGGVVGGSLLLCQDDGTAHALGVVKVGTNYLLSIALSGTTNGAVGSISLAADDFTSHTLRARKVGTNYLLELTQ